MNSRALTILVGFQALGKCFLLPVTKAFGLRGFGALQEAIVRFVFGVGKGTNRMHQAARRADVHENRFHPARIELQLGFVEHPLVLSQDLRRDEKSDIAAQRE